MISLTKVLSKTIRGNGSSTSKTPEGSEYDWLVEGTEVSVPCSTSHKYVSTVFVHNICGILPDLMLTNSWV
jgi:hypothetical protein